MSNSTKYISKIKLSSSIHDIYNDIDVKIKINEILFAKLYSL
jgi:hypothetical protein